MSKNSEQASEQQYERVDRTSTSPSASRIEKLKELFPEAVSEGAVDFDHLKAALGEDLAGEEAYRLTWSGKGDAFRQVQTPSRGTLVRDLEGSVDVDNTRNIMIEGENLEALKLLYKSYYGRIRMIYIDPPYNTGGDFIYSDDYSESLDAYLSATGQADDDGNVLTSNVETSGRFHSSWLSMMYPRLFMARQLLAENGSIFVSIDDNEVHNLRLLMNEVFGEENFVGTMIWQKVYAPKNSAQYFSEDHDYIVVYARNKELWRPNLLPRSEEADARYSNPDDDPRGPWKSENPTGRNKYADGRYAVENPAGEKVKPPKGRYWVNSREKFEKLEADNRIWWGADGANRLPGIKKFLSEIKQGIVPQTFWPYEEVGHTQEAKKELLKWVDFEDTANVLNSVKPPRLIRRMLQLGTDPEGEDLVLDFFAGSAATAQAVLEQNAEDGGNRRYICVQFPEPLPESESELETIADIATSRMRNFATAHRSDDQLTLEADRAVDLGFRVYRLAKSNMHQWEPPEVLDEQSVIEQMAMFEDGLREEAADKDVLVELLLREGYSLNATTEVVETDGNTVYRLQESSEGEGRARDVADGSARFFYVCLDEDVRRSTVESLDLDDEITFVCLDTALNDSMKVNLALECNLKVI